ncbi:MAG: DNA-3-methyladenine glycosylase I [Burkholderiales bacterium]
MTGVKTRCKWINLSNPLYVKYHDEEWGKSLNSNTEIFELLSLETQVAGLSWLTVLSKRNSYREEFANFDISIVANYSTSDIEHIINRGKVIKSRLKIEAIVNNAQNCLKIIQEFGSLKNYFWAKINYNPIINNVEHYKDVPTQTELSGNISKELKKRGFKFIGSTTIYSFMQACGMVDDHENACFCKDQLTI